MPAPEKTTEREFDIVIYGATGFTGLRTAMYLARTYKQGVRWAISGRSASKLEAVRDKLVAIDPALSNLTIIEADASSHESLEAMAARTKVVLTTVGPFMRYGEPLVAACIKQGTHYVDSTGESPFVFDIIQKHHEEARRKNIMVVPQCGFDSIPSELGTKMVVDFLRKEYNLSTKSAKLSVVKFRGTASGGTFASLSGMLEAEGTGLGSLVDQNQLVPKEIASKLTPAKISVPSTFYDKDFQRWQSYFVMSSTNEKMVKRSHALQIEADGVGYGPHFTYSESMSSKGFFTAAITNFGVSIGGVALSIGPIRRFLEKHVFPPPGTGPTEEELENGHFTMNIIGESELPENVSGDASSSAAVPIRAVAVVQGGEPGYTETCRYLVESALCIVKNENRIRAENNITGGVLTPAFAFGQVLVDRLRALNVNVSVSKL
ncbi:hypothetical protein BGZ99_007735 [Dissophora globulifera]|uniref:Saccharopine dehydrogenase NADP binding domain-containing protein n=1 Tax=Dissophora globulifera TaxID=979702 RepID=A0A9P6UQ88_9FUNG|nr:hypothetical protein BGZ99_007735 [Dissophora globulifera]